MKVFSKRVVLENPSGHLQIEPACISIDGSSIAHVDKNPEKPLSGDVLDFGDKPIRPAFINSPTHLPMSAFRGIGGGEDLFFQIQSSLQPGDIRAFTRMGAYEALLSGAIRAARAACRARRGTRCALGPLSLLFSKRPQAQSAQDQYTWILFFFANTIRIPSTSPIVDGTRCTLRFGNRLQCL